MKTIANGVDGVSRGIPHSGHAVSVPELVERGIERCRLLRGGQCPSHESPVWLDFLDRQARVYRWEARWWGVLARWMYSPAAEGVHLVFANAAITAKSRALGFAEDYEQMAANSRGRRAVLAGER